MNDHLTLTPTEAQLEGYIAITYPYDKVKDKVILDKAIADMIGTDFCLIDHGDSVAIGRFKTEVKK